MIPYYVIGGILLAAISICWGLAALEDRKPME